MYYTFFDVADDTITVSRDREGINIEVHESWEKTISTGEIVPQKERAVVCFDYESLVELQGVVHKLQEFIDELKERHEQ